MEKSNKRLLAIVAGVFVLLSVPLIAMQFTSEVNWNLMDFIVAFVLLMGTGLLCELVLRKVQGSMSRLVWVGVILFALFLLWVEIAVGLFGSPIAGN